MNYVRKTTPKSKKPKKEKSLKKLLLIVACVICATLTAFLTAKVTMIKLPKINPIDKPYEGRFEVLSPFLIFTAVMYLFIRSGICPTSISKSRKKQPRRLKDIKVREKIYILYEFASSTMLFIVFDVFELPSLMENVRNIFLIPLIMLFETFYYFILPLIVFPLVSIIIVEKLVLKERFSSRLLRIKPIDLFVLIIGAFSAEGFLGNGKLLLSYGLLIDAYILFIDFFIFTTFFPSFIAFMESEHHK